MGQRRNHNEYLKCFELSNNPKMLYQNMQDAISIVFWEDSIVLNVFMRREKTFNNNHPSFYLKDQTPKHKSKISEKKETGKTRVKITEMENNQK